MKGKKKKNESMELELVLRETMRTETSSAGKKYIIIIIHLQTKPPCCARCLSMHDPLTVRNTCGLWRQAHGTPSCPLTRITEKSQERVSDLGPREEWDPDLLLLHPGHTWSIGITVKNGFHRDPQPPSHACALSALSCQGDPFMRTDPVISGQGASDRFTVLES